MECEAVMASVAGLRHAPGASPTALVKLLSVIESVEESEGAWPVAAVLVKREKVESATAPSAQVTAMTAEVVEMAEAETVA
jgi:hypothetical protein